MILSSLIQKFVDLQFRMDCPEMWVLGEDDNSRLFDGAGYITGTDNGDIEFRLYLYEPMTWEQRKLLVAYLPASNEKPSPMRLFVRDEDIHEWGCGWFQPRYHLFAKEPASLSGKLRVLSTDVINKYDKVEDQSLEVIFPGALDLPYEGKCKTEKSRENEVVAWSYYNDHHSVLIKNLGIMKFEEADHQLCTSVTVPSCEQCAFPVLEIRISEALVILMAKRIRPRIAMRHFVGKSTFSVYSIDRNVASMMPPFGISSELGVHLWRCLDNLLSFLIEKHDFDVTDLSFLFEEVIESFNGSLQGNLVSLSVFIEHCVNSLVSTLHSKKDGRCATDDLHKKVKSLKKHLDEWKESPELLKRVIGFLDSSTPIMSVKKKLHDFSKNGYLEARHLNAWDKVRNKLLHGKPIDRGDYERYDQYRWTLVSLSYRLIFLLIGFEGVVVDFEKGRTVYKDFPSNDSNRDEKRKE